MIRLVDVYGSMAAIPDNCLVLFELLSEREAEQSISHHHMPSYAQHCGFVTSRPYAEWYLLRWRRGDESLTVGSIYITKQREVGIAIFNRYQSMGFGGVALTELRRNHPGRLLANINPANERSIAFFKKHGATLIQHTYELKEE